MIYHRSGNILETQAEAIVNPVNCVGVMGKGLAKEFKSKYPDNFVFYKQECENGNVIPGRMCVFKTADKYVINFPTKNHWRDKSKTADIASGLEDLVKVVKTNNIKSIAIPAIGCGLGGLEWMTVKEKIEKAFSLLTEVKTIVYAPEGKGDNCLDLAHQFIERQTVLSDTLIKELPDTESKSALELFKECYVLASNWIKEENCTIDSEIREWVEYGDYNPYGIYFEPTQGAIIDDLTFCMVAADYNVRLLYCYLASKGKTPYRPIRVQPAYRYKYNSYYHCYSQEREWCWENSYYDEDVVFQ